MLLAAALTVPVRINADDVNVGENTGVTLGSGTTVYTIQQIDQQDVYSKALKSVSEVRQDALNDSRIKLRDGYGGSYVTVPEYLKSHGISEADYLNPKWSNALERIAIQRAVEAASYSDAHTRLNGESCFTASYQDVDTYSEILAWGNRDISGAVRNWASEKDDYIKAVNGENHGEIGHYYVLIGPGYTHYGFGHGSVGDYGSVWAGEPGGDDSVYNGDTSPTNLKGTYKFTLNISDAFLNEGYTLNLPDTMIVGQQTTASVDLKTHGNRFKLAGTWSSSDENVAQVSADGVVKAVGSGKVTVTNADNGKTFSKEITVYPFRDVNGDTPHVDDIIWMASSGVAKGWPESDGTSTFRGMNSVVRQDMAAFIRREAVRLGVADAQTWKPSSADWKTFKDVNSQTPHAEDILWMAHAGIAKGYPDGKYGGMIPVYRQDMAAFLHRLGNLAETNPTLSQVSFKDVNSSTPHQADIIWLGSSGVAKGYPDGTFGGMIPVYRQDMAAFIHRMDLLPHTSADEVSWVKTPEMDIDSIKSLESKDTNDWLSEYIAYPEKVGYPRQWDPSSEYTSDAIAVIKDNKFGIYDYSGNELYPITLNIEKVDYNDSKEGVIVPFYYAIVDWKSNPNNESSVFVNGFAGGKDTDDTTGYYFSNDFRSITNYFNGGIGLGGNYKIFVVHDGRVMEMVPSGNKYIYADGSLSVKEKVHDRFVLPVINGEAKWDYTQADVSGWALADRNNNILGITNYEPYRMKECVNGFMPVKVDGKVGFVNLENHGQLIASGYDDVKYFEDGYAPVKKGNKWGFIDENGHEVSDFIFDEASPLYNGRSYVKINGKFGILDVGKTLQRKVSITMASCTKYQSK